MKTKVYIHCEITKREFEAKILLSTIAAENEFEVYMGNILGNIKNSNLPSGIFHHKDCGQSQLNMRLFKKLKEKNFLITCQDEEGGLEEKKDFFSKPPIGTFHYRFGEKSLNIVDALFSWSNFDYINFIKRFPKQKNKIYRTGNPRADLWSKKLKNIYKDNKLKKYILINSHTAGPSNNKTFGELYELMYEAYFKNKDKAFEEKKKYLFDNYACRTKYMQIFSDAIINLANNFKRETFIFRPHPIENLDLWKFIFRKNKNIIVTKEKSSTYWMHRSKILIQNGCYTAVEAANLGINIVTYVPKEIKKYTKSFTGDLGFKCSNEKTLNNIIGELLTNKNKNKQKNILLKNFKKVNSRFDFPLKELNSLKIVNVWKELLEKSPTDKIFYDDLFFTIKLKLKFIKYILSNKEDESIYLDRKFENIRFNDTNLMVERIKKIFNLSENIKFEKINNQLCKIYKK